MHRFDSNVIKINMFEGYLFPYIISPLSNTIEIHMLRPSKNGTLIQVAPIPGITKISDDSFIDLDAKLHKSSTEKDDDIDVENRIFVCAPHKLYILCMRHFHVQVNQLQRNREFEEALDLCGILQNTPYELEVCMKMKN